MARTTASCRAVSVDGVSALGACSGNQTKAAKRLGISRRALIYKMEKHGLKPPPAKE